MEKRELSHQAHNKNPNTTPCCHEFYVKGSCPFFDKEKKKGCKFLHEITDEMRDNVNLVSKMDMIRNSISEKRATFHDKTKQNDDTRPPQLLRNKATNPYQQGNNDGIAWSQQCGDTNHTHGNRNYLPTPTPQAQSTNSPQEPPKQHTGSHYTNTPTRNTFDQHYSKEATNCNYYWRPSETHQQDPFLSDTRRMIQDQQNSTNTMNLWPLQQNSYPYAQTIMTMPYHSTKAC